MHMGLTRISSYSKMYNILISSIRVFSVTIKFSCQTLRTVVRDIDSFCIQYIGLRCTWLHGEIHRQLSDISIRLKEYSYGVRCCHTFYRIRFYLRMQCITRNVSSYSDFILSLIQESILVHIHTT